MTANELVAAAGVALAIVGFLFVALLALRTRPRDPVEAKPTMELRDEPPALVDLLTDDFDITPESVPATLLDLAARRWLDIEQYGDAQVLIRLRSAGKGELRPYERQVLDHVRGLAIDGVVPTAAMTTGPDAVSQRWWKRFRASVVADAQAAGLCRPRWGGVSVTLAGTCALAAIGLAWLGSRLAGESDDLRLVDGLVGLAIAGGLGLFGVAGAIASSDRQRETPRGLEVAGHWLGVRRFMADHGNFRTMPAAAVAIWDKYLAHAVALDLAPLATAQLPLGAEDDRHAWSPAGRRWRAVVVRYPRWRPGYGRHPLAVAAVGLVVLAGGFGVFLLASEVGTIDNVTARRVEVAVLAVVATLTVFAAITLVHAVGDAFGGAPVEGLVLRARMRETGDRLRGPLKLLRPEPDKRRRRWYLALDDGRADRVRALRVRPQIYNAAAQGMQVQAIVTRRLRYVRSITTIGRAPMAAGPATSDPAFERAAGAAEGAVRGEHAVTGHDDRARVLAEGAADRAPRGSRRTSRYRVDTTSSIVVQRVPNSSWSL